MSKKRRMWIFTIGPLLAGIWASIILVWLLKHSGPRLEEVPATVQSQLEEYQVGHAHLKELTEPALNRSRVHRLQTPDLAASTDEELLAASMLKLKRGNLAYSTPEKMKTGSTEHVTARIGGSEVSASALIAELPAGKERAVALASTRISPRMKMKLKSADFHITPLSSEEQNVGGEMPTTWEWDIVPKHSGKLRLHLAAVVEIKNLSPRDFTSIDRDITVQVDPVDAVTSFIKANWQWIIATLTAIAGAAWKLINNRKKPVAGPPLAGVASP